MCCIGEMAYRVTLLDLLFTVAGSLLLQCLMLNYGRFWFAVAWKWLAQNFSLNAITPAFDRSS